MMMSPLLGRWLQRRHQSAGISSTAPPGIEMPGSNHQVLSGLHGLHRVIPRGNSSGEPGQFIAGRSSEQHRRNPETEPQSQLPGPVDDKCIIIIVFLGFSMMMMHVLFVTGIAVNPPTA
jgi:hypothetical protein